MSSIRDFWCKHCGGHLGYGKLATGLCDAKACLSAQRALAAGSTDSFYDRKNITRYEPYLDPYLPRYQHVSLEEIYSARRQSNTVHSVEGVMPILSSQGNERGTAWQLPSGKNGDLIVYDGNAWSLLK